MKLKPEPVDQPKRTVLTIAEMLHNYSTEIFLLIISATAKVRLKMAHGQAWLLTIMG